MGIRGLQFVEDLLVAVEGEAFAGGVEEGEYVGEVNRDQVDGDRTGGEDDKLVREIEWLLFIG